jgi:hypothetical protein
MLLRRKLFPLGIVLFVLLCSSLVVSVDAVSMWSQAYGGAGDDWACSVVATSDGGYAIAGTTDSFGAGGADFWLVKTDANGVMEWNRTYGGTGDDLACSLVATSDGGYALAGTWNDSIYYGMAYYGDFWLVKTDAFGNMLWNGTYGETGENKGEYASSLVAASDGGYTIAGTLNFLSGFWLVKTDASGNIQWNRTYIGEPPFSASSLVATSDEGYTIAGYAVSSDYNGEGYWLAKTDVLGNMQWNQTYAETGGLNVDGSWSLIATSDGGYAIAGRLYHPIGAGGYDFWLVKTDEFGFVPEYSSWLISALVLTATAFVIINRKRLLHKRS